MLKIRLIPVLLLQNGLLVRSEEFKTHQIIGNPLHEVERFNHWNVDELIYLDISREDAYDRGRGDHKIRDLNDPLEILDRVSQTCFMPLTWGGRIRDIEAMRARFRHGADKITLNTAALLEPSLLEKAARVFGSQAIVASIDARRSEDGTYEVFSHGGQSATGMSPQAWARQVQKLGAGEILLQSIDRDGGGEGYDVELIGSIAQAVEIPVIALGGVGRYEDYAAAVRAGAAAVAAANIWHFKEMSDRGGKRALHKAGIDVRL